MKWIVCAILSFCCLSSIRGYLIRSAVDFKDAHWLDLVRLDEHDQTESTFVMFTRFVQNNQTQTSQVRTRIPNFKRLVPNLQQRPRSISLSASLQAMAQFVLPCETRPQLESLAMSVEMLLPCDLESSTIYSPLNLHQNGAQLAMLPAANNNEKCKSEKRFRHRSFRSVVLKGPKISQGNRLQVEAGGEDLKQLEMWKLIMNDALLKIRFMSATCEFHCSGATPMYRATRSCMNRGVACDFERACNWTFSSLPESTDPRATFKVVAGRRAGTTAGGIVDYNTAHRQSHYAMFNSSGVKKHTSAIIMSPYYQTVSDKCRLSFAYRIYGPNSPKIVVAIGVQSQHDSMQPTLVKVGELPAVHTYIDSWKEAKFNIGSKHRVPFRLHIECLQGLGDDKLQVNSAQHTECYIDDVTLHDCDELEEGVCPMKGNLPLYVCERSAAVSSQCVYHDQLCDMSSDCALAEDEDSKLHNCTQVPTGARCTFESEEACGWTTEMDKLEVAGANAGPHGRGSHSADVVDAHYKWRRLSPLQIRHLGTMKHDRFFGARDHTYGNDTGHYMYLATRADGHAFAASQLFTPYFPPLAAELSERSSPLFGRCSIRFYFCYRTTISTTAQMILTTRSGQKSKLWEPPKDAIPHVRQTVCAWTRASVLLNQTVTEEYRIGFQQRHMLNTEELAIDDFSMSPECFMESQWTLQSDMQASYNLSSCGAAGWRGPTQNECDDAYNGTGVQVAVGQVTPSLPPGWQSWTVPKSGEYRISAYGAQGGSLHEAYKSLPLNQGSGVQGVFNLTKGSSLRLVVGQTGASPCELQGAHLKRWTPEAFKRLGALSQVCSGDLTKDNNDTSKYPGAGGGGASVVFYKNRTLLVAAGGGGYFGAISQNRPSSGSNGLPSPLLNAQKLASSQHAGKNVMQSTNATIGGGAFVCLECGRGSNSQLYAGQDISSGGLLGGHCPTQSDWSHSGGFGGGGASCGAGGGGGGGYFGGDAGDKLNGNGGWSWLDASGRHLKVLANSNAGDGYILVEACALACPKASWCRFIKDQPKCVCRHNGEVLNNPILDQCKPLFSKNTEEKQLEDRLPPNADMLLFILVVVGILFLAVCIISIYLVYHYGCLEGRGSKYGPNGLPLAHFSLTGHNSGNMQFNPDYEFASAFADLREIPRCCVTLIKALGQGAFGEVYQGTLTAYPEENCPLPIAVKTLPELVTETAQLDFTMEALIMSKFNHENIVRFIGVCFEKMPRFIVLELLAGGDLKTFLRSNRPKQSSSAPSLSMADLLSMSLDVARGCQYLEDNHFIHRDIAARNCLLTTKEAGRVVKIADFGMARDIYRADYYRKGGKAMLPVKWMPPEAFLDGIFTSKTDVWSYGVLLWEMFSMGYMPYPGRGNQEVMQLVTAGGRLEAPIGCPEQVYDLMTSCWATVAEERPRFSNIVDTINSCLTNQQLALQPLPPVVHERRKSAIMASMPPLRHEPILHNPASSANSRYSQAPFNRPHQSSVNYATSSECSEPGTSVGTAPSYQHEECPLPTNGTGVTPAACAPYRPQNPEPYLSISTPKNSISSSNSGHVPGQDNGLHSAVTDALLFRQTRSTASTSLIGSSATPGQSASRQDVQFDDEVFETTPKMGRAAPQANNKAANKNLAQQQQSQLI